MIRIVGQPAVRAFDEPRVLERDHIEQRAGAELALGEPPADRDRRQAEAWVDEQLDRVIARLAMDVDGAGEIGRARVVQPVVVGKPAVAARDRDQLARARMVEPEGALAVLVQHLLDPLDAFQQRLDLGDARAVLDVDVGDLVIGEREGG